MSDDTIPQDDPRPLTEVERYECAADWSDYRKDYGVSADGRERMMEHRAFTHAWRVEHTRHVMERSKAAELLTSLIYRQEHDAVTAAPWALERFVNETLDLLLGPAA